VEVTWDPAKNRSNRRRHGLSFEEAAELFTSGVDYLELFDELHSDDEDRFIAIGPITRGVVLVVHTVHEDEDVLRIISARFATKRERTLFRTFQEAP
jgi:uncharacterized protein